MAHRAYLQPQVILFHPRLRSAHRRLVAFRPALPHRRGGMSWLLLQMGLGLRATHPSLAEPLGTVQPIRASR
jgi:hypothetical protein